MNTKKSDTDNGVTGRLPAGKLENSYPVVEKVTTERDRRLADQRRKKGSGTDLPRRLPTGRREGSYLVVETKAMDRSRRLLEQQGERQFARVQARDHSNDEHISQSPEGELQNTIAQHPELDSQRYDGVDPNLNPEPPLNTDARREFDNEKREQDKEKQLRLGNMPKFSNAPVPRGPG